MTTNFAEKNRVSVKGFDLIVLGGTFTVSEIIVEDGQTEDEVMELIRSTPADRWFVILADSEGTTQDVLALIDDEYDFLFVGLGTLESE